ncbi:MAG: oxidoreductase, partial [Tritonibacter mobilis]|nr:oxidoreductase [Tritonibacter mobilis]
MRSLLVAVVALFATFCSAIASEGEVVLTLRNGDQTHEFTIEDLRNLGEREVVTETIWSDGEQRFVGVSLDRLMTEAGVSEGTLEAAAVNDYAVEIPMSDARPDGPIVAYMRNGKLMSLRDKGP